MSTEPWAAFFDEPDFLPPGELARWQREEARIRAEEQRREAEGQERAEIRQELAVWSARQRALAAGKSWDPARPFEHEPSIFQRADLMFSLQDAEQRAADRRALQAAGLHHLVADLPHPGSSSSGEPEPPASRSRVSSVPEAAAHPVPLAGDFSADQSVAARARRALRRWSADARARAAQGNREQR